MKLIDLFEATSLSPYVSNLPFGREIIKAFYRAYPKHINGQVRGTHDIKIKDITNEALKYIDANMWIYQFITQIEKIVHFSPTNYNLLFIGNSGAYLIIDDQHDEYVIKITSNNIDIKSRRNDFVIKMDQIINDIGNIKYILLLEPNERRITNIKTDRMLRRGDSIKDQYQILFNRIKPILTKLYDELIDNVEKDYEGYNSPKLANKLANKLEKLKNMRQQTLPSNSDNDVSKNTFSIILENKILTSLDETMEYFGIQANTRSANYSQILIEFMKKMHSGNITLYHTFLGFLKNNLHLL